MDNLQISHGLATQTLRHSFSTDCTWHGHIKYITDKAWDRINVMRKFKYKLDRKYLEIT